MQMKAICQIFILLHFRQTINMTIPDRITQKTLTELKQQRSLRSFKLSRKGLKSKPTPQTRKSYALSKKPGASSDESLGDFLALQANSFHSQSHMTLINSNS